MMMTLDRRLRYTEVTVSAWLLAAQLFVSTNCWGADWPRFLGPNGDGSSSETGLTNGWDEAGPPRIWAREIGTGYSAPAIRDGRLVLHHRVGGEEIVECFDINTRDVLWRHAYPSTFVDPFGYNNGPRCSPILTEAHVYTFGAEGVLLCLDVRDGTEIWRVDTQDTNQVDWTVPEAFFGVGSTPTLDGDRLYVMVGGQPNSGVVAFHKDTGEIIWENVGRDTWTGEPMVGWPGNRTVVWRDYRKMASYAAPAVVEIHGEPMLLAFMRQGLVGLVPETGEELFSFWFRARVEESVNAANPIVVGNAALISSAYYDQGSALLNISEDRQSVTEVWRETSMEAHFATPIYHEGFIYGFSGRNEPDARFRCVNYADGTIQWDRDERWFRRTKTPDKYGRGSLIKADGKLFALGEGGLLGLFALDPKEPRELARAQIEGMEYPSWSAPVLSDKRLYLRSESQLICLDVAYREPDKEEKNSLEPGP